jgi:copper transport protein
MSADVPDLRDGTYVVAWHAISADSHPVSGAFTFSVRSETATTPGLVARLLATDHTSTAEELGLGIGRSASYVGLALLLGTFAMLALCDSDALRSRRAAGLLGLALVVGVVGTAVMIAAQSSLQVGDALSLSGWRAVAETSAGRWWVVRLALFAFGAVLIPLARRVRIDNAWSALVVAYCGALLAVVTAGGHGVSGRWIPLGFVATMVHLGAMSL